MPGVGKPRERYLKRDELFRLTGAAQELHAKPLIAGYSHRCARLSHTRTQVVRHRL